MCKFNAITIELMTGIVIAQSVALASPTAVSRVEKQLAPGVAWTQEIDADPPLIVNVVIADLDAPDVRVEVGPAQDGVGGMGANAGCETVGSYARRHEAVAAVNGDFFPFYADPLGIEIHRGELLSEPWTGYDKGGPRSVLGITPEQRAVIDRLRFTGSLLTANGTILRVCGVDREPGKNEIVVLTPTFAGVVNSAGGVDAVVTGVDLPLRANKVMTGTVASVYATGGSFPGSSISRPRGPSPRPLPEAGRGALDATADAHAQDSLPEGVGAIPTDGVILAGGVGMGGAGLLENVRAGTRVRFVLSVGPMGTVPGDHPFSLHGSYHAGHLEQAALPDDGGDLEWGTVAEAVGGGPRLLTGGVTTIDSTEEGFDADFVDGAYPRTAVGTSDNGRRLYLVTVDGWQAVSSGVSLSELASILRRYGATDAINLDGGGSTTMAVDGITVDSPGWAGIQHPVADMLVIKSDNPIPSMPNWAAPPEPTPTLSRRDVDVGQTVQISLSSYGPQPPAPGDKLTDSASSYVIWQGPVEASLQGNLTQSPQSANGSNISSMLAHANVGPIGFVDQSGRFTAVRAGTGLITAWRNGQMLTLPVTVYARPAAPNRFPVWLLMCGLIIGLCALIVMGLRRKIDGAGVKRAP